MVNIVRWLVLLIAILLITVLSLTGLLQRANKYFQSLHISLRLLIGLVVTLPLTALIGPILLDMWHNLTKDVVGLGWQANIWDPIAVFLITLNVLIIIQTAVLAVKLKHIEEGF
ncbi:hypothetical protein ACKVMT_13890 [Halobacteriales archaeon Cl-PHB]